MISREKNLQVSEDISIFSLSVVSVSGGCKSLNYQNLSNRLNQKDDESVSHNFVKPKIFQDKLYAAAFDFLNFCTN